MILGVVLALVSQSDGVPPIPIPRVFRMIAGLPAITAIAAAVAGVVGFELSRRSIVCLPATLVHLVPPDHHHRFMAVWFVHGASYVVGVTGGSLLSFRIWRERGRPQVLTVFPHTKSAIVRAVILVAIAALIIYLRFVTT